MGTFVAARFVPLCLRLCARVCVKESMNTIVWMVRDMGLTRSLALCRSVLLYRTPATLTHSLTHSVDAYRLDQSTPINSRM